MQVTEAAESKMSTLLMHGWGGRLGRKADDGKRCGSKGREEGSRRQEHSNGCARGH